VPDSDRVGEVDQGWTVGTRWMFHERMLYNSPYVTRPAVASVAADPASPLLHAARAAGRGDDPLARELVGEARALAMAERHVLARIAKGVATGAMSDQSSAIGKLFHGVVTSRISTIGFEIAGGIGAAWDADDGAASGAGNDFLMRQTGSMGGGTTEMARNVISERVLGMPRERTLDRDVPFREVPRSPSSAERDR
jgi:alkylation response protein AidB-like acyl-CoA dehydrogenase